MLMISRMPIGTVFRYEDETLSTINIYMYIVYVILGAPLYDLMNYLASIVGG